MEVANNVYMNRDDDGSHPWWKLCGTGTPDLPADATALTGPPVVIETDGDGDVPIGSAFTE